MDWWPSHNKQSNSGLWHIWYCQVAIVGIIMMRNPVQSGSVWQFWRNKKIKLGFPHKNCVILGHPPFSDTRNWVGDFLEESNQLLSCHRCFVMFDHVWPYSSETSAKLPIELHPSYPILPHLQWYLHSQDWGPHRPPVAAGVAVPVRSSGSSSLGRVGVPLRREIWSKTGTSWDDFWWNNDAFGFNQHRSQTTVWRNVEATVKLVLPK